MKWLKLHQPFFLLPDSLDLSSFFSDVFLVCEASITTTVAAVSDVARATVSFEVAPVAASSIAAPDAAPFNVSPVVVSSDVAPVIEPINSLPPLPPPVPYFQLFLCYF